MREVSKAVKNPEYVHLTRTSIVVAEKTEKTREKTKALEENQ
jgi:hypothetical protein